MRISDGSSDVCSSDLRDPGCGCCEKWAQAVRAKLGRKVVMRDDASRSELQRKAGMPRTLASCQDRKSVVYGKSVSVRVDLGGRRIIKKKKKKKTKKSTSDTNTMKVKTHNKKTR